MGLGVAGALVGCASYVREGGVQLVSEGSSDHRPPGVAIRDLLNCLRALPGVRILEIDDQTAAVPGGTMTLSIVSLRGRFVLAVRTLNMGIAVWDITVDQARVIRVNRRISLRALMSQLEGLLLPRTIVLALAVERSKAARKERRHGRAAA